MSQSSFQCDGAMSVAPEERPRVRPETNRPRMAWTRMSPQGKDSQRIGAWWKPEEPEPCWICPLSYRLNCPAQS